MVQGEIKKVGNHRVVEPMTTSDENTVDVTEHLQTQDKIHFEHRPIGNGGVHQNSSQTIPEQMHNSFSSSSESAAKENALSLMEGSSPRSVGSERSLNRERFNPFNRVPFIEDDHFDTMGNFPSVSGTSFAGDKDDFGKPSPRLFQKNLLGVIYVKKIPIPGYFWRENKTNYHTYT